ncbi:MAG TPA: N-acetyltransferase, partial [bacterium]|nr:N-acetyltransferase [bacterium]
LTREEIKKLTPGKNPFWEHAEGALFLAFRGDEPVGRIAAVEDFLYNRYHGEKTGAFGFFESVRDPETAAALFAAAEEWMRNRGLERSIGPLNPSTNDVCALLIEGFDSPPRIMMPYNPPWYRNLIEGAGYAKAKDLLAYDIPVPENPDRMNPRLGRLLEGIRRRGGSIRYIDLKRLDREIAVVREIYNSAWAENWGFVPLTEAEAAHMARELKPLAEPRLAFFAEYEGKPAGVYIVLPDYNQVLKTMGGKLGPVQILKFLLGRRKISAIRLMIAGIRPEYRKKGLDVLLFHESAKNSRELGYVDSEISWLLEDNTLVIRATEAMGGTLSKRYRIFAKDSL